SATVHLRQPAVNRCKSVQSICNQVRMGAARRERNGRTGTHPPCVRFLMAQYVVRPGKEGSMQTRIVVLITTVLTLWTPVCAAPAAAGGIRLAQLSGDTPIGTERSPRVIIEEPRPPSMAIETEGRGERHDCRAVTT